MFSQANPCCFGAFYDVGCTSDCQARRVDADSKAWADYSRAWPEAMCGYEFYHADELAAARERGRAIARGLRLE